MQVIDSVLSLGLSGEFTPVHYIIMAYNMHRVVTFKLIYNIHIITTGPCYIYFLFINNIFLNK